MSEEVRADAGSSDVPPAPAEEAIEPTPRTADHGTTLAETGLFDPDYYLATYRDIAEAGLDPLHHYVVQGHRENRRPNAWFDPVWYRETYLSGSDEESPFFHYVETGDALGHRPHPLFDTAWYRTAHGLEPSANALAHYLANRLSGASPMPEFDADFYLASNPDVAAAKIDPFDHYWRYGFREGRDPSPTFNGKYYSRKYLTDPNENPLKHYLINRASRQLHTRPPEIEDSTAAEIRRFTKPSASFEEFRPAPMPHHQDVLVLAYYLTQFHSFPENDRWWGTGFTEWTNIARGVPRFKDHYQPRVPRDLGFYSLLDPNTMRAQIRLAKAAGIGGFCYYYYWFNKRRLMERPLESFLADRTLDMPFCLMWANENWTRRWDGMDSEVLISQDYSTEDELELIADLARHFVDERYIRLGGRPLFFIYRANVIPECRKAIERWRSIFRDRHGLSPLFVMAQCFGENNPTSFDFDGAIEFPPHKLTNLIRPVETGLKILDDAFDGKVYSYDDMVRVSLDEPEPAFPLIKTIVPSWDNDARRQGTGLVLQGSTPDKYEGWLSTLIAKARQKPFFGTPIVAVNAWNEWCEGAYLEPDLHFGSAYLNATARAVAGRVSGLDTARILLVGHDAFPSGAQQLLLHLGRTFKSAFGLEVEFLLLGDGALLEDYQAVAPTAVCVTRNELTIRIEELWLRGVRAAICNTSVSGLAARLLVERGMTATLLVHELPGIIREKGLENVAQTGIESASNVVFPCDYVRDQTLPTTPAARSRRLIVRPQGRYKDVETSAADGQELRRELGIPPGDHLVLGVGYADLRKGFDTFLQLWRLVYSQSRTIHFCWTGKIDPTLNAWLGREISAAIETGTFHMPGYRDDMPAFYAASDVFALTSREDPFPSVALEALSAGVPVIAFKDTGGIPELLDREDCGYTVEPGDVLAFSRLIVNICFGILPTKLTDDVLRKLEKDFDFRDYVRFLLGLSFPNLRLVSAVVPNYNYARYLPERIQAIFHQTYLVSEILVLDDASVDDSVDTVLEVAGKAGRDVTLHVRDTNSGSVFAQWRYGAEQAGSEFVWIAEADDAADPSFLAALVPALAMDEDIAFAFCDSRSIDAGGNPLYGSYKGYYETIEPGALSKDAVYDGPDFVERYLAERNVVLNASAVVWRRTALLDALRRAGPDVTSYRMAGDWRIYLEALAAPGAKVAYLAEPLNVHRRHGNSVTHLLDVPAHLDEVERVHDFARRRLNLSPAARDRQARYMAGLRVQMREAEAASA